MTTKRSPEKRKKIRALEAKRDTFMAKRSHASVELKKVRAELKEARK